MTRAISLWAPVVLYMAGIFYLSARSDVAAPASIGDTAMHSAAYGVLGVLFVRALAGGLGARIAISTALIAALLTAAYGVSDELHQMFVPGRVADLNDVIADAIGAAIGAFACWLWGILFAARHGL